MSGSFVAAATASRTRGATVIPYESRLIEWNASSSGDATGYSLKWGTSTGVYPNTVSVGNVLQYPIASMPFTPGVTYYMIVMAHKTGASDSPASSEIVVRDGARIA